MNVIKTIGWALLFLLTACVTDGDEPLTGQELVVGDRIPDFEVVMNDGRRVSDEDLLGNVSLIAFFHTACKDCQQELPMLQRFYEAYPRYPLICISREEGADSVSAYWTKEGFTMPYSAQDDRTVYQLFARQVVPRIYVVDAEGVIRYIYTDNPLVSFEELEKAVFSVSGT